MDGKFIVLGVVVVLVIAVVAFSLMNGAGAPQNNTVSTIVPVNVTSNQTNSTGLGNVTNSTNVTNTTNVTTTIPQNNTVSNGTLFSNSSYYSHSVLISTAVLTPQARSVMTNYTLSTSLQNDGSSIYNLTSTNSNTSWLITVLQGQALYFINTGYPTSDNATTIGVGYAITDSQGYVDSLVFPI